MSEGRSLTSAVDIGNGILYLLEKDGKSFDAEVAVTWTVVVFVGCGVRLS